MSLVDEIPVENLKERSLQVPKKGKIRTTLVSGLVHPQEKPDPHLLAYYFLCVIVYFWVYGPVGGQIWEEELLIIFFLMFRPMQVRFFHWQESFPASALSAPSSVICWGVSDTTDWYVKTRRCGCQNWMWKKELLPDPSVVRIFSLFCTCRDCFFRFGSGSAFSLCEVETVRLLTLTVMWSKW